MNRYFSSFQKSRGGRSPPQKFEEGTRPPPPVPPGIAAYETDIYNNNVNQQPPHRTYTRVRTHATYNIPSQTHTQQRINNVRHTLTYIVHSHVHVPKLAYSHDAHTDFKHFMQPFISLFVQF